MPESGEKITINVTLDVAIETLTTIVENAKKIAGPDDRGIYRVDPAERVNQLIAAFLKKHDFDAYAKNIDNYDR